MPGRPSLGIVTDRDIVVAVVALNLDPAALSVGDIMGAELNPLESEAIQKLAVFQKLIAFRTSEHSGDFNSW
jgi:hypothetical protein